MNDTREVDFSKWCPKCKYKDIQEGDKEIRCDECLSYGYNIDSRKPVNFEAANG